MCYLEERIVIAISTISGDFMVISWWFYGDFMVISWWFHGDFMVISWSSKYVAVYVGVSWSVRDQPPPVAQCCTPVVWGDLLSICMMKTAGQKFCAMICTADFEDVWNHCESLRECCVYIYIHIYIYTFKIATDTDTYTYTYTYIYMSIFAHIYIYMYTRIHIYIYLHIHM